MMRRFRLWLAGLLAPEIIQHKTQDFCASIREPIVERDASEAMHPADKAALAKRQVTQTQVARDLGVSPSATAMPTSKRQALTFEIAKRLLIARRKLGLTQYQLAQKSGLSVATYKGYEYGKRLPGGRALVKLCDGAGIDIHWLLTGAHPKAVTSKKQKIAPVKTYD